ncbi:MAG: hypothetical protein ACTSXW_02780 [Candidatus Baldrarchaeia archaeon]
MAARTIFNIIRVLVILFGISVSALSTIMTYDAASLNINFRSATESIVFNVGPTTVEISTEVLIEHRGILFTFSNVNVTIYIFSNNVTKGPVASDMEVFTLNPGESTSLTFNFEIERSVFDATTEWTIIINVKGIMSLVDKNFVSFALNYTQTI